MGLGIARLLLPNTLLASQAVRLSVLSSSLFLRCLFVPSHCALTLHTPISLLCHSSAVLFTSVRPPLPADYRIAQKFLCKRLH